VGNKRREAGPIKPVKGIPGGDCDSCLDWLRKYTGATKGCRAKVADIARDQFTILLDDCVRHLLDLALPEHAKNTIAKAWAGTLLVRLHASLEAHQWKLGRENPAYRKLKAKIPTRADVLVPKSEISKMVREEIIAAETYQQTLWFLRDSLENQPVLRGNVNKNAVKERIRNNLVWQSLAAGDGSLWTPDGVKDIENRAHKARPTLFYGSEITESVPCTWQDVAQQRGIPKRYWPTIDLAPFCAASADKWWDWLWPRILEEKNVLLPDLDPSKHKKQIRGYFDALVQAREDGTF
jgi:hypothetical protein